MTPTEKDALDRWSRRIRDTEQDWPPVDSEDAMDRVRTVRNILENAMSILEDGLPF